MMEGVRESTGMPGSWSEKLQGRIPEEIGREIEVGEAVRLSPCVGAEGHCSLRSGSGQHRLGQGRELLEGRARRLADHGDVRHDLHASSEALDLPQE